jgi:hypothetical protein
MTSAKPAPRLKFNLIENARDSLKHAVTVLAWPDAAHSDKFKQALLAATHAVELLLKERLHRVAPAFVWENVDKYPSLAARTVTLETALNRLEKFGVFTASESDKESLFACRNIRNAIEHFEFDVDQHEAKLLLGKTLSFLFAFARDQLELDLEEDFKGDDTWSMLVEGYYEFAAAHGERISSTLLKTRELVAYCHRCDQETVDLVFERCALCGARYEPEESEG